MRKKLADSIYRTFFDNKKVIGVICFKILNQDGDKERALSAKTVCLIHLNATSNA